MPPPSTHRHRHRHRHTSTNMRYSSSKKYFKKKTSANLNGRDWSGNGCPESKKKNVTQVPIGVPLYDTVERGRGWRARRERERGSTHARTHARRGREGGRKRLSAMHIVQKNLQTLLSALPLLSASLLKDCKNTWTQKCDMHVCVCVCERVCAI